MSFDIKVKEATTRLYEVEGLTGHMTEFEAPREAVESVLYYWLVRKARCDSVHNVGRFLLREGTDELVDKIEELREWLKVEDCLVKPSEEES